MFSDKLKVLRTAKKLSQKELAGIIGVTKSVVSFYESGDRFPSYDVLVKISCVFNVTTDYLLGVDTGKTVNVSGLLDSQIDTIHHIIAENTIDERIMNALRKKDKTQSALIDAVKANLEVTK